MTRAPSFSAALHLGTISGLTSGTAYQVQERADDGQTETGNGSGPWSASQTATPRGVPDAPANLDVRERRPAAVPDLDGALGPAP